MKQTFGDEGQESHLQANKELVEIIRRAFEEAEADGISDVGFERSDGKLLNVFVSGSRAWLLYRRDENDAGFSSRNPDYTGPKDATLTYIMNNFQQDEYPAAWTISVDEAMNAVEYFLRTGEMAPGITWHDNFFPKESTERTGKFLDVLVNGGRAWLRYRSGKDDPGLIAYHSQNPSMNEGLCEFVLDSGQRVVYPLSQTISKKEASQARRYFLRTGEKFPDIDWHNAV